MRPSSIGVPPELPAGLSAEVLPELAGAAAGEEAHGAGQVVWGPITIIGLLLRPTAALLFFQSSSGLVSSTLLCLLSCRLRRTWSCASCCW